MNSEEHIEADPIPQPSKFDLRQREIQQKGDETYRLMTAYFEQLEREREP